MPGSWTLGNARLDRTADNIRAGVLFQYNPSSGIYKCPSDSATVQNARGVARTRSYSADIWLNVDTDPTDCCQVWINAEADPLVKTKSSQLLHPGPSSTFVFVDEHEQSIDDGVMVVGHPGHSVLDTWYKLPADRHDRGCNISFVDGRAEHWSWAWPKRFVKHGQQAATPGTDPAHGDASDLHRLQACLPR
jgi:prepilin-type processing-associated H-X9-DG protein